MLKFRTLVKRPRLPAIAGQFLLAGFCSLVLTCCSYAQKTGLSAKKESEIINSCPTDGNCTVAIKAHQALVLSRDEFGSLYYKLVPDPTKNIIIYTYDKAIPKGLQDGSYREEIILELENAPSVIKTYDFSTGKPKALFGRFCYCKGYTGYYEIKKGSLSLSDNKNTTDLSMDFQVSEVPQVLKSLRFSASLK